MRLRPILVASAAVLGVLGAAGQVLAWGATGHRMISEAAMEALPATLPAFLKRPEVVEAIGEYAREPDRSRNAGQPHDADLDPGHFIDLDDQGKTLAGTPINAMPRDLEDYESAVHGAGASIRKAGYLYYNLIDGYQQLVKDFAYIRVETLALSRWTDPQDKAWLERDLKLREALTVRDLGVWSHFVGDASQPMHVSIHYNGWGEFPNPKNYTEDKIHGPFEGEFVVANATPASLTAAMPAPAVCPGPIQGCIAAYLSATAAKVQPLYALWTEGGFKPGDRRGVIFADERLGAAAAELRDLVVKAWAESEDGAVGHPEIKVRDVEAGTPVPFATLHGDD